MWNLLPADQGRRIRAVEKKSSDKGVKTQLGLNIGGEISLVL